VGWLQIVLLVVEIIKLIMKLRSGEERTALFSDLGQALDSATSFGDRQGLKGLRDRVKARCKECAV
jgi:hypothetical protein